MRGIGVGCSVPNHRGRYTQRLRKGIAIPWPDDVPTMQALVKDHCLTKAINPDSEEEKDVARELLKCFQIGVTDKSRPNEPLASRI